MLFTDFALDEPIVKAVLAQGYTEPTPIQEKAIPAVLSGQDVMAAAQTGTGKTAGFTLPILQKLAQGQRAKSNHIRALILTPTRELAAQVAANIADYGVNLPLSYSVVFGGVKINPQMMKLRKGVDILVATPGRLLDLFQQNAIKFSQVEVLVLDEADRMLDMGFINDIKKIIKLLPTQRQNLLFSATFSEEIRALAKGLVKQPIEISVNPANMAAKTVTQWLCPVDKNRKAALLCYLIKQHQWRQVLVFTKTKHGANKLTKQLDAQGISALAIHGNKSQGARTKALAQFNAGEIQVLVATDIAARGIDIDQLPCAVNFDLPHVAEDYVHRIGRTGRAGAEGEAVSLVCADEFKLLKVIERLTKQVIRREIIAGFEPVNALPNSNLDTRDFKAKKPKKEKETKDHSTNNRSEIQNTNKPVKKKPSTNSNPYGGFKGKSNATNKTQKSANGGNNNPSAKNAVGRRRVKDL
jgi:ATP-dependent RNA helicase RhlE